MAKWVKVGAPREGGRPRMGMENPREGYCDGRRSAVSYIVRDVRNRPQP